MDYEPLACYNMKLLNLYGFRGTYYSQNRCGNNQQRSQKPEPKFEQNTKVGQGLSYKEILKNCQPFRFNSVENPAKCTPQYLKKEELLEGEFPKFTYSSQGMSFREILKNCNNNQTFENNNNSDDVDEYEDAKYNFNVNNMKYVPPLFSQKTYLIPKVYSKSLSMKFQNPKAGNVLDYGISETIKYKTQFPNTLHYERVCPKKPPYVSPLLILILKELDAHVPPIISITGGSSKETIENADSLLSTLLTVNINETVADNLKHLYLYNIPVRILTNMLLVFFQRLQYPLFLATRELCEVVSSNDYDIRYTRFGCIDMQEDNMLIRSLIRALANSSLFQISNLTYFMERCQRWVRSQIKYELDRKPNAIADTVFEEAVGTISMVFGKSFIGIPKHYVAHKIIDQSLPILDELRRTIFYLILGFTPFELWHIWSINSMCYEDKKLKSKTARGAFLAPKAGEINMETLPYI